MQKAARITTLDPQARLAVLLATTGLTQLDLARLVRVAGRTVRRWMEGVCKPPAAASPPSRWPPPLTAGDDII
jgi:DNA-binding transcriptional regulator YiaG